LHDKTQRNSDSAASRVMRGQTDAGASEYVSVRSGGRSNRGAKLDDIDKEGEGNPWRQEGRSDIHILLLSDLKWFRSDHVVLKRVPDRYQLQPRKQSEDPLFPYHISSISN
jgi:hypothetical protein